MVVRRPETWLPGQCCQLRVVAGVVLQCLCLQGVMTAMTITVSCLPDSVRQRLQGKARSFSCRFKFDFMIFLADWPETGPLRWCFCF